MNCHESTYSGFSFSTPKRHKTVPRPASNIPVRTLRRAYASDSGATVTEAEVSESVEAETADTLNPMGFFLAWFLCGYLFPSFFMYWLVVTVLLCLLTPTRYWLAPALIVLAFKVAMQ